MKNVVPVKAKTVVHKNKIPKISVLMTAYNSEKYIAEAIDSILNQTFTDFEFIIINDGSTDNTAKIVRSYMDGRIKFVDNAKNQGLIAVLNQGLDLCTGEYVARMDSDDISLPTRFEKQVAYLDANPDVGLLGTSRYLFCVGQPDRFVQQKSVVTYMDLLHNCPVVHPSVMIRRSVLEQYNFRYNPADIYGEDYGLWARMIMVTKIRNLPDALLRYRWHESNISNVHKEAQRKTEMAIKQKLLGFLSDVPELQNRIMRVVHDTKFFNPEHLNNHMKRHHPIRYSRLKNMIERKVV